MIRPVPSRRQPLAACARWMDLENPGSGVLPRMPGYGADTPRGGLPLHVTIMVVRVVQAQYQDGVLRPAQRLSIRPGEQVSLIVLRRPDPSRRDLARLAKTANGEDHALAEQGLTDWAGELDEAESTWSEVRSGGPTSERIDQGSRQVVGWS